MTGSLLRHPGLVAAADPDRPAIRMGASGTTVTYQDLDERSNRLAHLLRARGLEPGDNLAILLPNEPAFLEAAWAAQRGGLYYTAINTHLSADEAAYIINDSDARAIVAADSLADTASRLGGASAPGVRFRLLVGGELEGWERYERAIATQPATPIPDESEGDFMLYSSGTTGKPKGIRRPLSKAAFGTRMEPAAGLLGLLGFGEGDVYLSPAPLYHAAPLGFCMAVLRLGGTVVVMERFDAAATLDLIARYRVTHAQFVPTMFSRLLRLPATERQGHDLSSLRQVVHAAAPCPVDVKRDMIEWWGPIIAEYYAATEGHGATFITSEEWLTHPGSVGRPMIGGVHILDDDGRELPAGEIGTVWFAGGPAFEYHNDPAKTAEARNADGWATTGDVGYLDGHGYLYLTDRRAYVIISGGVNIYPQEAENVLVGHPRVLDAAVFGVPNPEMGEEVKAVVQPADPAEAGPELEAELIAHCRERLAGYKCPRSVDFTDTLPRLDNGKLYKRVLRDRYWTSRASPTPAP